MKSVVWRQKSNMIKKQDSSFSYRNHSGLTRETTGLIPETSGPSPLPLPHREGSNMWGYPYWAANRRINRCVHPCYRGISVITPLPLGEGKGEGQLLLWTQCVLFFCVILWEIEYTLAMRCHTNKSLGSFFSHRAHRVHGAFWRTFRAHRGPSAYREHRALLLSLGWKMWELRRSRMVKNPYNTPSWPPSTHADVIAYNRGYNPQEISV